MSPSRWICVGILGLLLFPLKGAFAQNTDDQPLTKVAADADNTDVENTVEQVKEQVDDLADEAQKKIEKFGQEVDRSPQAKEITAGLLQPIYQLAEQLSFPWFHWLAFMLMTAGIISYGLQLVLAKLVVLSKLGFSPAEILSDAHGLVISVIGLVLTTQAAAENSTFTQHPFSVLSAAVAGLLLGFIFYRWGQSQEVQATMARRRQGGR